ncbi:MAG: N-6 DNA methylase [Lachnospiraceae bacterium]|nr:N-6 DNA methylase [Lachnospiraceae bacterium]
MTDKEQKNAAKKFAEYWKDKGYEKGESQPFWLSLLRDVFGVSEPEKFIAFEEQVHLDHTSFIDGHISVTNVLIEQKSKGKNLRNGIKQSDGSMLTPFQQAKRYSSELPYSQRPRWIVTCNFEEFLVYDMEKPNCEPEQIFLKDLSKEYYRLNFLTDTGDENIKKEMEVSLQAGELVGKLYNAILKQYKNPENPESLKSLNMLCVRLVFCLYAEDAGIFGRHNMFHDYLKEFEIKDVRRALIDLFKILDTKAENRDPYLEGTISEFPYVNGGLFAKEDIEIPNFDEEIVTLLLNNASMDFDWSAISPTIFGAVFESTLNPETRRSGGMHYTSIENIHKVIDPLFLDDLKKELDEIKERKRERDKKLLDFQDKLSSLKFLDPACGSGNFLTETYISLRRLENEAIKMRQKDGQIEFDLGEIIKVSIGQFYGIEINDFAVSVAKTALWIAESQMMHETEEIVHMSLDFLPLKSYANIREENALRIDWEKVVPKNEVDFIMGNPPFAGRRYRTEEQIEDVSNFFNYKDIDYVACWYKKASVFIQNTNIRTAFVSTNSIVQGEQVRPLWEELFNDYNIKINFAYKTFLWDSESSSKAHVHCVIISFSCFAANKKMLYDNGVCNEVKNINGYLIDAPNIFLNNRNSPICHIPKMQNGNVPLDGDALKIEVEDYEQFKDCKYIKQLIGGTELINNKKRYVLWLVGVSPKEIHNNSLIKNRVELCRKNRLNMKDNATRKLADTPTTFRDTNNPDNFIALPMVSSEKRKYIPMAFFNSDYIPTNQVQIVPNATLYHFGILTSNVHMAWVRTVCGRLKSDYRYSKDIVYNNFPWCDPTPEQKAKIEQTAQAILDARALYPECSLADLYDELTMPKELRKAHQNNDRAVMQAYGFDVKTMTESECVGELMKMYQRLTK